MLRPSTRRARLTWIAAVTAVAVAGGLAPASAQDTNQSTNQPTQAESFTPEQLQLAQRAIAASKSNVGFDDILPLIAEQTKGLFIRSNPALAGEIETVTQEVAMQMVPTRRNLDRTIQEVWARRFTNEELEAIIAFYESTAGSKLANLSPEILALSVGAAKQWSDELATQMVTRVREEMQKRGFQL